MATAARAGRRRRARHVLPEDLVNQIEHPLRRENRLHEAHVEVRLPRVDLR